MACASALFGSTMLCESVDVDRRRDVLHERAAGGDVQHLGAAADREQRQVGRHRPARQIDLELVAPRLGIFDRRVPLLAVEHGVDVAAAGQEQAVELAEQLARALADLEHARPSAGLFDRRDVVVQAAAPREADRGFHVLHSLSTWSVLSVA